MSTSDRPVIRRARDADLPALLALESQFPGDRLSPRQMRAHLGNPRARLRVAQVGREVRGYALLFLRRGSALARLYSIAVDRAARGLGLGARLLDDVEREAHAAGAAAMRLEVRDDNVAAVALYRGRGYQPIAALRGYYEDGGNGTRYEKALAPPRVDRN